MRMRARVAGLIAALAVVASLSGCITVHGETAVVPATTKGEAKRVLDRFVELADQATQSYDAKLTKRYENGPKGAIDEAALRASRGAYGDQNTEFRPLQLTDTTFHIPQQAGWPKFFVADSSNVQANERWLLVFTRHSVDERWLASYLALLPLGGGPELAKDDDGYLADLPVDEDHPGLAMAPRDLSAAYARYLNDGEGPFAAGTYTTDLRAARESETKEPSYDMDYQDEAVDPAVEPEFAPVAMRTADGGALVLFTTHHFDRQLVAEGYTPSVHELVAELMEGEAVTEVTREWIGMQAALVPEGSEGEGEVEIVARRNGVIAAQGR